MPDTTRFIAETERGERLDLDQEIASALHVTYPQSIHPPTVLLPMDGFRTLFDDLTDIALQYSGINPKSPWVVISNGCIFSTEIN